MAKVVDYLWREWLTPLLVAKILKFYSSEIKYAFHNGALISPRRVLSKVGCVTTNVTS